MNVTNCHLCGSQSLKKVLDLGFHPLADFFLKENQLQEPERRYPLSVLLCQNCGHGMNSFVVPAEVRYQENDYSYDSGNSKISVGHFTDMAKEVSERAGVQKGELIVDIGSNIGTLLGAFKNLGATIQGVDPAPNIVALAEKNGIPTINDFFNESSAKIILKKGRAKAITITNAFNHISPLDEFMKCVISILDKEGSFVIELPYFLEIIRKKHFDVIYLEHVSYVAVKPLVPFFKKFGLSITHLEENDYMSGSIRIFVGFGEESPLVKKQIALEEKSGLYTVGTWEKFAASVRDCKIHLLKELVDARTGGGKVVAIGAAAKGNTLLNYCGIDTTLIDFATDASPLKIGKYTPGSHLPIRSDDAITEDVTHALILAWNIADFLKGKISPKYPHLSFITPHVIE
ncbi:methyltransferase domain-containing protein [Candidatus Kaiserbacteria bacterium]|nr:methyltransferase domain-containing protein [Candidatus Kaiserbacteria bacterium]